MYIILSCDNINIHIKDKANVYTAALNVTDLFKTVIILSGKKSPHLNWIDVFFVITEWLSHNLPKYTKFCGIKISFFLFFYSPNGLLLHLFKNLNWILHPVKKYPWNNSLYLTSLYSLFAEHQDFSPKKHYCRSLFLRKAF